MRCKACEYEHLDHPLSPGKEPFVEIVYKHGFSFLPKFLLKEKDEEVQLMACPQCGTVKAVQL